MDDGYQGNDAATRWGCGCAALIGLPVGFILTIGNVMGDCIPDTDCHHFWTGAVLPTLAIAAFTGLVVIAIVKKRAD